jgi:hypothetical protein
MQVELVSLPVAVLLLELVVSREQVHVRAGELPRLFWVFVEN